MTEDSRALFVAKGVGTFFGFLVAFLAASSYFGGGATGVAASVVLAVIVAAALLILRPRLHPSTPLALAPRRISTPRPKISAVAGNQACSPGPYDVVPGRPTKIPLKMKGGDTIDGYIAEVDGYDFNWCIVDEENLIQYLNGEKFYPLEDADDVPASKVSCKIPHDGPWYLLLDIYGKQITREVEVNLRIL